MKIRVVCLLSLFLLSSCGFGTFDRRDRYLDAKTIPKVVIPAGLDQPAFDDALVIPEMHDVRELAGQKLEVGLPEALATSFRVDQIVIKRLGDARWVFVDAPPAMVWPRLRQYWDDSNIALDFSDPSRGVMESKWLDGADGDATAVYTSLKAGTAWAGASVRYKFQLHIEPGLRAGSTEVYLEEKSLPIGAPVRIDAVQWNTGSDDLELEGAVLKDLAFYLGDHINRSNQISKLAANIGGQRAELIPDREKPVLKYKLTFDRAWATVGNALEDARISVEDLDRDSAMYYVNYDDADVGQPGFFSRLFGGDDKHASTPANRFLIHLDSQNDEILVTVLKDTDTLADALIAEKLLKIIKQYST